MVPIKLQRTLLRVKKTMQGRLSLSETLANQNDGVHLRHQTPVNRTRHLTRLQVHSRVIQKMIEENVASHQEAIEDDLVHQSNSAVDHLAIVKGGIGVEDRRQKKTAEDLPLVTEGIDDDVHLKKGDVDHRKLVEDLGRDLLIDRNRPVSVEKLIGSLPCAMQVLSAVIKRSAIGVVKLHRMPNNE